MKKTIICPECDGHGFINGGDERSSWSRSCGRCHGTGYTMVPMTMADRIRSMNDAELAVFIANVPDFCPSNPRCYEALNTDAGIPDEWCMECALNWLQKPLEDAPQPVGACEDKQESGLIEED